MNYNLTHTIGEIQYRIIPYAGYMKSSRNGLKKYHCYFSLCKKDARFWDKYEKIRTMDAWWDKFDPDSRLIGASEKTKASIYNERYIYDRLVRKMVNEDTTLWLWTGTSNRNIKENLVFQGLARKVKAWDDYYITRFSFQRDDYKERWSKLSDNESEKIISRQNVIPSILKKQMLLKLSGKLIPPQE